MINHNMLRAAQNKALIARFIGDSERLIYGVAINDVSPVCVNGKDIPSYKAWKAMLQRCYHGGTGLRAYRDCNVSDDWLIFSNFKLFYDANYIPGYMLDKDLLVAGNRTYSKDTCVFVPRWLNSFANHTTRQNGEKLPAGCSFDSERGGYQSYIKVNGKRKFLGRFATQDEASDAWLEMKLLETLEKKKDMDLIDKRIFPCVVEKVMHMRSCQLYTQETKQ